MVTIKEKAEEYTSEIENQVTNNVAFLAYKAGANYVLKKIESLIEDRNGEGEVYHYNLYMGLQKLVKELKGE